MNLAEFNPCPTDQQAASHRRLRAIADCERIDGLYLHLPFCFHKCHYCDFFSVVEKDGQAAEAQARFLAALLDEFEQVQCSRGLHPRTIFIGGGTPTYLRVDLWRELLDVLKAHGNLEQVEEFTVEANPETVTPELLQTLVAGGVNRLSIGAQSFDRSSLKALERWHDPDNVRRTVAMAREVGIDNLSLDLIFAIPNQTLDMLDRDLDRLLELEPDHLSTYGLTYEPNTALTARLRVGRVTPISEELERAMYERVIDRLEAAGYQHYEISNWARPGRSCQHNLGYWHGRNWLGFGPSAASHLDGLRFRNIANLARYIDTSPEPTLEDVEQLDPKSKVGETLMLRLRLAEGVRQDWLDEHLGDDHNRSFAIVELIELNLLERADGFLRLTRQGRFVADSVIAKLL
jgi:oxygen-independent coproporphyrinogen-3 oxidase